VKDSDKADMELLQAARRLRAEMELVTNELSTSEFQKQQAQNKCHTLERQATEQRSKEAELLANAQRLREEIMKTESEAAECQKDADRLDKEADDERNSRKERETIIAATKERATEIEKKLQKIRDELEI
jgi:chromosome segregation ATPase